MTKAQIGKGEVHLRETEVDLSPDILISGVKSGLRIEMSDGKAFSKVCKQLEKEFKQAPLFFENSVAEIGYGQRTLSAKQKKKLRAICENYHVLYRELPPNYKEREEQANALMITRTLRSGQKIEYNGHVVILGDVQPGAEVAAAGNILVWGALRGIAHAGAAGNNKALVCAMRLIPLQLRISDFVAIDLDTENKDIDRPEIAYIKGEEIISEEWDAKSFVRLGVALED